MTTKPALRAGVGSDGRGRRSGRRRGAARRTPGRAWPAFRALAELRDAPRVEGDLARGAACAAAAGRQSASGTIWRRASATHVGRGGDGAPGQARGRVRDGSPAASASRSLAAAAAWVLFRAGAAALDRRRRAGRRRGGGVVGGRRRDAADEATSRTLRTLGRAGAARLLERLADAAPASARAGGGRQPGGGRRRSEDDSLNECWRSWMGRRCCGCERSLAGTAL